MKQKDLEILKMLRFNITIPTANGFYEIISNLIGFSTLEKDLGSYLMEMFLLDYRYLKYKPSLIANSICFMITSHRKGSFNYLDEAANDFIFNYKNNPHNFLSFFNFSKIKSPSPKCINIL